MSELEKVQSAIDAAVGRQSLPIAQQAMLAPQGGAGGLHPSTPRKLGGANVCIDAPPTGPSPSSVANTVAEMTNSDTSSGPDTPGANGLAAATNFKAMFAYLPLLLKEQSQPKGSKKCARHPLQVNPDMDPKKASISIQSRQSAARRNIKRDLRGPDATWLQQACGKIMTAWSNISKQNDALRNINLRRPDAIWNQQECGKIMAAWSSISKSHPRSLIGTSSSLLATLTQLAETGPTDASLSDLLQQSQAFLLEKEKGGALGTTPTHLANYPPAEATHQQVCGDRELFMSTLDKLLRLMGVKIKTGTKLGGKEIDLHLLYKEVTTLGGQDRVSGGKQWITVCDSLSLPASATNRSFIIKKLYCNALNHYEQVYFRRNTCPDLMLTSRYVRPELDLLSNGTENIPLNHFEMMRSYHSSQPGPTAGYFVGGHGADPSGADQEVGGQGQGHDQEDGGLGHNQSGSQVHSNEVEFEVADGEGGGDPHPLCKEVTTLSPRGHPNSPLGPDLHLDASADQISYLRPGTRFCGTIDSFDGNMLTVTLELSSGQRIHGVRLYHASPTNRQLTSSYSQQHGTVEGTRRARW
eukprot:gene4919-34689_t